MCLGCTDTRAASGMNVYSTSYKAVLLLLYHITFLEGVLVIGTWAHFSWLTKVCIYFRNFTDHSIHLHLITKRFRKSRQANVTEISVP